VVRKPPPPCRLRAGAMGFPPIMPIGGGPGVPRPIWGGGGVLLLRALSCACKLSGAIVELRLGGFLAPFMALNGGSLTAVSSSGGSVISTKPKKYSSTSGYR
jgi:hypothetical protein